MCLRNKSFVIGGMQWPVEIVRRNTGSCCNTRRLLLSYLFFSSLLIFFSLRFIFFSVSLYIKKCTYICRQAWYYHHYNFFSTFYFSAVVRNKITTVPVWYLCWIVAVRFQHKFRVTVFRFQKEKREESKKKRRKRCILEMVILFFILYYTPEKVVLPK